LSSGSTTRLQRGGGAGAQHGAGFVQALVELLEAGGAGAHAHRQVAEHEAQHDDQAVPVSSNGGTLKARM
jgi:DNA-binding transcriptional regulator YbjK